MDFEISASSVNADTNDKGTRDAQIHPQRKCNMNKLLLWMNVQKLNKSQICVCSVILQSSTFYRCSPGQGRWDPSDTDILIMGICMDMVSPTTIRAGLREQ